MTEGFTIIRNAVPAGLLEGLRQRFAHCDHDRRGGLRNALEVAEVLAAVDELRPLANRLGGAPMRCVRGIVFDKTPAANWRVAWHQDRSIAVTGRSDVPGFGPWSIKEGVDHVQPPADVLESMVTLRLHLDACGADNGPLRVIPGSHCSGILDERQMERVRSKSPAVVVACDAGDVLAMRPLLLHASSAAAQPARRRVVHLEYCAHELPEPMRWRWRV